MAKKKDTKESLLNSASGVGVILLAFVVFLLALYVITIAVRFVSALGAL